METVLLPENLPRERLLDVANMRMPFGRYAGRYLRSLPEAYLHWFVRHGFPSGRLGEAMQLALIIKSNGLSHLLTPLIQSDD